MTKEGHLAQPAVIIGQMGVHQRPSQPARYARHPRTGEIWLHEHGPKGGDEINILSRGNYGWPIVSHGREYYGGKVGKG